MLAGREEKSGGGLVRRILGLGCGDAGRRALARGDKGSWLRSGRELGCLSQRSDSMDFGKAGN